MDSFFSLFDPSEGQSKPSKAKHKPADGTQDHVKKKAASVEVPKVGRRRGRRSQGKGSPLPEESSFLCQPQQGAGVLLGGSYIEDHLELNVAAPCDGDKRLRRRNSARKSRRKRTKASPPKELLPWPDADAAEKLEDVALNNRSSCPRPKNSCENLGKNVNDLRGRSAERTKRSRRRAEPFALSDVYCGNSSSDEVHNVIDKLEKVSLKDDAFTCGEFNPADLGDDVMYSDDGDDTDSYGDSASELEDTSDETYGSLPPEPRYGGVEYKLQLVSPCERRFQHLVTQLKWRLRSGGGAAIYVVGVRDCGALRGLRAKALRASLRTLRRMARALGAHLAHVTARRVAPHRAVAEVYIRKLAETQQSVELRVAVTGANEAGKSTLIGVLTQGELDNGRGSARLNMFRHVHEVRSGRTSSLSHEILGFDAQGNVVNYGCSELMTAERIGERSAKLVSFLDLAGHRKYQRTTVSGLTGYSPHYAMLVVSATAGITHITEEHIGLLLALDLPFFTVISKCELEPYGALLAELAAILKRSNKKPLLITDEHLARNCVGPRKLILDSVDTGAEVLDPPHESDENEVEQIPVFPVSSVKGIGLNALHAYLLALAPPVNDVRHKPEEESCEFQIDEIFHVGDSAGPVVGGLLARGRLYEGDNLLIGPLDTGEFVKISVNTIYRNRVPCDSVRAGQSASLGLSQQPPNVRPGMVLLAVPGAYNSRPARRNAFRDCSGKCGGPTEADVCDSTVGRKHKNQRRREKNFLKDIQLAEDSLKKTPSGSQSNIFKPEVPGKADRATARASECGCVGEVYLDDPNDPRGCLYFQATVHLLRHSTAYISPGFQCTVHIGNVRQTAIIEGILSPCGVLSVGARASVVFRFARWPEYVRPRRRLLLRAGRDTTAVGRLAQVFPYIPDGAA